MKQFTLSLAVNQQRPIIKLNKCDVLLDTGAEFPVWVAGKRALLEMFKVELLKKNASFKGFGGIAHGDVYKIENFVIGELTYAGLDVIVCEDDNASFMMILSATMFRNLIYQIDDKNHKLNIDIPAGENPVRNLVIADSNGRMHVLCGGVAE